MDGAIVAILAGAAGLGWGFLADRLAARWPAHEDGAVRPIDWRTPLVVIVGGLAFALTVLRYGDDPRALVIVGAYAAALVVLFATDLDQFLLPDVITLPLVAAAVLVIALGASPFLHTADEVVWAVTAAVLVPLGLALLARPFGPGAIGQGDLKLLVGVGLLTGATNLVYGLIAGALAAGVAVAVLVFVRRLSLKDFVPYGPFLILGALYAILVLPRP
jgi:leader peptidase (prepilin peptidase)/N-methyltransferase